MMGDETVRRCGVCNLDVVTRVTIYALTDGKRNVGRLYSPKPHEAECGRACGGSVPSPDPKAFVHASDECPKCEADARDSRKQVRA